MAEFIAPLSPEYTINLPEDTLAWVILGVWFLVILMLIYFWRDRKVVIDRRFLSWLAILSAMILVVTPFFGVFLNINADGPAGEYPVGHMMVFAAVPWMVAGGLLGTLPAGLIAGMSGLLLAYLDTSQITTPLIFMTIAVTFSWAIKQPYRSTFFKFIRYPAVAGLFSLIISIPGVFLSAMLSYSGPLGVRFAVGYECFLQTMLPLGGMVLIGSFVCTFFRIFFPSVWHPKKINGHAEAAHETTLRVLAAMSIIFIFSMVFLVGTVWHVVSRSVRGMLIDHLTRDALVVSEGFSIILETGENQIQDLASAKELAVESPEELKSYLAQESQSFQFFEQVGIFDLEGAILASSPSIDGNPLTSMPDHIAVLQQAFLGEFPSSIALSPEPGGQTAQLGFFAGLIDSSGNVIRILWGQKSLSENAPAGFLESAFADLEKIGGTAQVIDSQAKRFYHTNRSLIMMDYTNPHFTTATYFENTFVNNQMMMMFYQPIGTGEWAVITEMPVETRYLLTWEAAFPIFLIGFISSVFILLIGFLFILPSVRKSGRLKAAVNKVIEDQILKDPLWDDAETTLNEEIYIKLVKMLNQRIQQQNQILSLTAPNPGNMDLSSALQRLMRAALLKGVSSVRIVFREDFHDLSSGLVPSQLGLGDDTHSLAFLDSEILRLVREKVDIVFQPFELDQSIALPEDLKHPGLLFATALAWHENWYGVMWFAFPERQSSEPEDLNYLKLLVMRTAAEIASYQSWGKLIHLQKGMETILDGLSQAIAIINKNQTILYLNSAFAELIGDSQGSILGKEVKDLLPGRLSQQVLLALRRGEWKREIILENQKPYFLQIVRIHHEGTIYALILNTQGSVGDQAVSGIELVKTASHELRSPLTLIHGYAKILRLTGNLNEQQDNYLIKIIDGIEEMDSLVNNLLNFSRLESDAAMELSEFDVSKVVHTVKERMEAQIRQKNIQFSISLPEKTTLIRADLVLLTQAVKNLVDNALKYTKMGGEVSIDVRDQNKSIVFAVKDTGSGIAPLDQNHIFDQFRQGYPSGGEVPGGGLGLSIVRSVAERHGGKVWLESRLGQGSTFYIEIPKKPFA